MQESNESGHAFEVCIETLADLFPCVPPSVSQSLSSSLSPSSNVSFLPLRAFTHGGVRMRENDLGVSRRAQRTEESRQALVEAQSEFADADRDLRRLQEREDNPVTKA